MNNVFVINLKSRPDRWELIKRRFANTSFKLERLLAVVKPVGSYGHFLSVIKAIKLAKKRDMEDVLILEDDCLPKRGFETKWKYIKSWLKENPDKWDIFSGGSHSIFLPHLIGETHGIKMYNPVWAVAAHWLFIPKRSYNKLLNYYESVSICTNYIPFLGIDVHNNFLKTVISVPYIAYQDDGYSNISKKKRKTRKIFRNSERAIQRKTI
jgi:GR25 family glycosyltransferase involved in LPS biosynthesis